MRLTLYTENCWIELGVLAAEQWASVVMRMEEFDAVQVISDEMIARVKEMETAEWHSFTEEFRQKMIAALQRNLGKHLLITTHFIKQEEYMNVVALLNDGKTLEQAVKMLRQEEQP